MSSSVKADATPEKRLFVSLVTRDISLIDAVLDLVDNSINAALEPLAGDLTDAPSYQRLLSNVEVSPSVSIAISVSEDMLSIEDNASGMSIRTAQSHVFKFGRGPDEGDAKDRLSVYGIGLKRAMFKIGNLVTIKSDSTLGGFDLSLDVARWEKDRKMPWTFDLQPRPEAKIGATGTKIEIRELYEEVSHRIGDGVFLGQLRERISRTYAFFIDRVVNIEVNGRRVEGVSFDFGSNNTTDQFEERGVSCGITAGIALKRSEYKQERAGWYVFCNGRTVVSADKGALSGWTGPPGLPQFQPKHRPFLGIVFFVSTNAELLPWTTTKSAINEESSAWQEAKRRMTIVGRAITGYLDKRYNDDGTEITSEDLEEAAGPATTVLAAATGARRTFEVPKKPPNPQTKVQYWAMKEHIDAIGSYLRRPGMAAADVGRYTFDYFLKNRAKYDA